MKYTDGLTAEQLIQFIATDYHELSHEKIAWQRDNWKEICRSWLKKNWLGHHKELDPELRDWEYDDTGVRVWKDTNEVYNVS